MQLSNDEVIAVRRARLQERTWPYVRVFWLVIAVAAASIGGKLLGIQEYVLHPLGRYAVFALLFGGVLGFVSLLLGWNNRQRQLLLKLAAEIDPPETK